jgi:hypothetical protein
MPGRSYQTKPGLPSECQVNIKCFYAKSTCLGSNDRNICSLTLVQKVIPRYLQRTVDNYSRAYLWLISHDLSHGVPLKVICLRHFVAATGLLRLPELHAFSYFLSGLCTRKTQLLSDGAKKCPYINCRIGLFKTAFSLSYCKSMDLTEGDNAKIK